MEERHDDVTIDCMVPTYSNFEDQTTPDEFSFEFRPFETPIIMLKTIPVVNLIAISSPTHLVKFYSFGFQLLCQIDMRSGESIGWNLQFY